MTIKRAIKMTQTSLVLFLFLLFHATISVSSKSINSTGQQQPVNRAPNYNSQPSTFYQQTRPQLPVIPSSQSSHQQQPASLQYNHHRQRQLNGYSSPGGLNQWQARQQQQQVFHRPQMASSICQIPDELLGETKCTRLNDEAFNSTAIAEFKSKLDDTSQDLRHLLKSYLHEFSSLSLGVVLLAQNETLKRLNKRPLGANFSPSNQHQHVEFATRKLFDSMLKNLATATMTNHNQNNNNNNLPEDTFGSNQMLMRLFAPVLSPLQQHHLSLHQHGQDISPELSDYFRRLHLVYFKRLLELKYLSSSNGELDFDCLDSNLANNKQTVAIESLLASTITQKDNNNKQQHLELLQNEISVSVRQSVEYAKTLLGSIRLASETFDSLVRRAAEWLPNQHCHLALARMTVCQQCQPNQSTAGGHLSPSPPPCENYCLNVARGCMNDLYELNPFWAEHVNLLTRFKTNLIQTNNLESVMASLDEKLYSYSSKLRQQYSYLLINSTVGSSTSTHLASMVAGVEFPAEVEQRLHEVSFIEQLIEIHQFVSFAFPGWRINDLFGETEKFHSLILSESHDDDDANADADSDHQTKPNQSKKMLVELCWPVGLRGGFRRDKQRAANAVVVVVSATTRDINRSRSQIVAPNELEKSVRVGKQATVVASLQKFACCHGKGCRFGRSLVRCYCCRYYHSRISFVVRLTSRLSLVLVSHFSFRPLEPSRGADQSVQFKMSLSAAAGFSSQFFPKL